MNQHNAQATAKSGTEKLARLGYLTKGIVYMLIGGLAVATVVDASGSVGGGENAIRHIGSQPFGAFLLIAAAIGLAGYALWQAYRAIKDPENAQNDKFGTFKRVGYGASAAIHVGLAVAAVQMVIGASSSGGGQETYLAKLMGVDTIGPILGFLAGVFVVGFGIYQIAKGVKADFVDELRSGMSQTVRTWVIRMGRAGLIARGVVFTLMGASICKASLFTDPSQMKTMGEALREIGSQTFGAVLLVLAAGGLALYGAYQFALARYRRIHA